MSLTTSSVPEGKQTPRPSLGRIIASKYLDILICGFIAWLICFTFTWQTYWLTITLFLWVGELFWCRDRLVPTVGEYSLGIRYMTSTSSQVVADIQVIHPKLKLNSFLLAAGIGELTLAFVFFCGWTFVGKAVVGGFILPSSFTLFYWAIAGFAFFVCSGYLLNGCKAAFIAVPLVHGLFLLEFYRSYPVWKDLMQSDLFYTPWVWGFWVHIAKTQPFFFLQFFTVWSLAVLSTLILSRKHLAN